MHVRDATFDDLPAILAIHNHAILHSTAIWSDHPADLANRRAWYEDRVSKGQPVLVADDAGEVAGFASYGSFRSNDGYRLTVEDSIYIRHDRRGRGLAKGLMQSLLDRAAGQGMHVMVAGIGLPNVASVGLHAAFGFVECGVLREIGLKDGQWLDLLFMQKTLG